MTACGSTPSTFLRRVAPCGCTRVRLCRWSRRLTLVALRSRAAASPDDRTVVGENGSFATLNIQGTGGLAARPGSSRIIAGRNQNLRELGVAYGRTRRGGSGRRPDGADVGGRVGVGW